MPGGTADTLTVVTALGAGLAAGVFFAFSTFVMRALARLGPAQGVAAMQAINVAAITPAFMLVLFGSSLGAIGLVVDGAADIGGGAATLRLIGGLLYLLGPVGLTVTYHVPSNERLAALDPASSATAGHWARYVTRWTAMNHVRTAAALAAATLLTVAHGFG